MTDITAAELVSLGACEEGYETFVNANGESATYLEALESNGIDDFFWYLKHTELTERQESDLRVFARQQALINVDKIVDYCSQEDYNTILSYLQTGEGRSAAESAAWSAARSAAWSAAELAARSAWSAAWSAAESAARSAWSAAWSAAESAAWSAELAARSAAWSAAELAAWSAAELDLKRIVAKW